MWKILSFKKLKNGHDVKPPKVVTVDIINFASSPNINFETEEQIDEFLEKIKNELKNELENADVINLKLWGCSMVETITKCLNEWNATIEALGQGKQSI